MQHRTEFLFAHWAVPALQDLRGVRWRELVTHIAATSSTHPDALAFALMMVRLNGCVNCDAKRYRERGGCGNCTRFVLCTLSKESEGRLLRRFRAAQKEVAHSLKAHAAEKRTA
jgi:hypothetical protein